MRIWVELHNRSYHLSFSSHRRTDDLRPPICNSFTSHARKIDHLHLDSPTNDLTSTIPDPCRPSNFPSRQKFGSSRTRTIHKSLRKMMSCFSRNSVHMCSPPAFDPQAYTAEEYAYLAPAELPGDREPCELAAQVIPGLSQATCRHEDAKCYAKPVDAVAWQRHHPLEWATGDPTNAACVQNASTLSTRALTPIDTSMEMARVSALHVSAHNASPNRDHGHDYRATGKCGTLLSPTPTLSPSSLRISPSTSISPTASVISGIRHHYTAKPATHFTQATNNPLQRESGFYNSQYYTPFRGQHSYNDAVSPISPATDRHANPMLTALVPLAMVAKYSHQHPAYSAIASGQLPNVRNAQQNVSAFLKFQYGHSDPSNDSFQFAQRRLSASEQYMNGLSSHTSFDSQSNGSQLQRTACNSSFNLDEPLPAYEASRSVSIYVEDQIAREVQANTQPLYQQNRSKRTAAMAARPIVHLPPLSCIHCGEQFTGKYQKANCLRHINCFHSDASLPTAGIDDGKSCRTCFQRFRRPDARRKHEWKQHRIEDCRPNKRRIEKRSEEKRIYLPPMADEGGNYP